MPFNPSEAKNPTRELSNNTGTVYQLQDINHDEIVQQIKTNEQNITANAERVQANETELATHDADIKELQKNNPVVELKDTVTESAETNSETHDIKETTSDGTENAVSNFVLAQKQITKLETDTTANTLTVSTIDQTGTASSETLALPAGGGGSSYDDTQVKADIAKNTADITAADSRISTLETDNATNKENIQKNAENILKITPNVTSLGEIENSINIEGSLLLLLLVYNTTGKYNYTFILPNYDATYRFYVDSSRNSNIKIENNVLTISNKSPSSDKYALLKLL